MNAELSVKWTLIELRMVRTNGNRLQSENEAPMKSFLPLFSAFSFFLLQPFSTFLLFQPFSNLRGEESRQSSKEAKNKEAKKREEKQKTKRALVFLGTGRAAAALWGPFHALSCTFWPFLAERKLGATVAA